MNCLPVPGFPDYEVSDCGRVFSLNYGRTKQRKELRATTNGVGYPIVRLHKNKKPHNKYVHRLVMEAHVGPCPPGMEVCHNDGNPANFNISNLRYDTRSGNFSDKHDHGTDGTGSKNAYAKLTEADVLSIRARYVPRVVTQRMLADEYGVTHSCILLIVHRRVWTHI